MRSAGQFRKADRTEMAGGMGACANTIQPKRSSGRQLHVPRSLKYALKFRIWRTTWFDTCAGREPTGSLPSQVKTTSRQCAA